MTQVVNPEHEKVTPTPENVESSPALLNESKKPKNIEAGSEPVVNRGVDGKLRAQLLLGGAEAVVKPLVVETFIGEKSNEMMQAGKAVAEGASQHLKEGDTEGAQAMMEKEIKEQGMESDGTFTLSEAIREVPNVYAIEPGGFDTNKMGNKMNFSSDMMFGINPAEADHMLELLQHPKSGVGEFGATFALKKNSPLDKEKEGFEVTFQDENGVKKEIMFLYLNMKGAETPAQQTTLSAETSVEARPVVEEKPKEEAEPEKPVESVVDAAAIENETESDTNRENDEKANNTQENTEDTVAESAENATTAEVLDTRDDTTGVSNVININRKPVTQPVPPQGVSEQPQDLSKAA